MKRSEMLEHIQEEIKEFLIVYQNASESAKPHKVRAISDGILAMVEGFGMLPPPIKTGEYYSRENCGPVEEFENKWE